MLATPPTSPTSPSPAEAAGYARQGHIVDPTTWIPQEWLDQQYNQSWLDMGTLEGPDGSTMTGGVWHRFNKGLSPAQEAVIVNRLTTQWDKAGATDRELQRQSVIMHGGLDAAKACNMAAGSQAVLVTFQKILDPDSVVRESEYARSKEGQSLVRQLEGLKTKLEKGGAGLTPEALQEYVNLADKFVAGAGAYRKALKGRLQKTGKRYGIPDDIIFEEEMISEGGDADALLKKYGY